MSNIPVLAEGEALGTHRTLEPSGVLPQPAWRVDNDFSRLFRGELLLAVETLNIDAASFVQMEGAAPSGTSGEEAVKTAIFDTIRTRGKQHNPVTGSGGMLLGKVLQIAPGRPAENLRVGDRIATLVSLSLTPLRVDAIHAVRSASAQLDVTGQAVIFASSPYARMPDDMPDRLALALFDVAGAAPQVARLVPNGGRVVVFGAGGKSGILCVAEARRKLGAAGKLVGVEYSESAAGELRGLGLCDAVLALDARDAPRARAEVLAALEGVEADVCFSCVNIPDAELAPILVTRPRGVVYYFAMSTSFTKAALGAEGVGRDVDLMIGNGFAEGHAEHTLSLVRDFEKVRALFQARYG